MAVGEQTPLPRLRDPQQLLLWSDRLITELWRRLFEIAEEANTGGAGSGETNTGANVGTDGVGVYDGKVSVQLQFRNIAPATANSRITVTLNGNDIDLHVVINDSGTSVEDLWSANKIASELAAISAHGHTLHDEPSGSGTGPYTLAATPVLDTEQVFVNGLRQKKDATPGYGEYSISGDEITFGWDVGSEYVVASYKVSTAVVHVHTHHEEPSGSGVGPYTLASAPDTATEEVFVNGVRQKRKASSPGLGEYYMSASDQITFGWDVGSEYVVVDYLT